MVHEEAVGLAAGSRGKRFPAGAPAPSLVVVHRFELIWILDRSRDDRDGRAHVGNHGSRDRVKVVPPMSALDQLLQQLADPSTLAWNEETYELALSITLDGADRATYVAKLVATAEQGDMRVRRLPDRTTAYRRAIEAPMPGLTLSPRLCDRFPVARCHETRLASDHEQGCHVERK